MLNSGRPSGRPVSLMGQRGRCLCQRRHPNPADVRTCVKPRRARRAAGTPAQGCWTGCARRTSRRKARSLRIAGSGAAPGCRGAHCDRSAVRRTAGPVRSVFVHGYSSSAIRTILPRTPAPPSPRIRTNGCRGDRPSPRRPRSSHSLRWTCGRRARAGCEGRFSARDRLKW